MKEQIYETINDLFKVLNDRERYVLSQRFSLNFPEKRKVSLEDVGNSLGLTRERIRQIQNTALAKISAKIEKSNFLNNDFLFYLKKNLGRLKLKPESCLKNKLFYDFNFNLKDYNAFFFLVEIHPNIFVYKEDRHFYTFLYLEKHYEEIVKKFLNHLNALFKKRPFLKEEEFIENIKKEIEYHFNIEIEKDEVLEFIKIFKMIFKNPFSEIGHFSHYRIVPRSLIEKIKLLLIKEDRPLHFKEIYRKLIEIKKNEDELIHKKWKKNFSLKTIHSTLNTNDDFILVGRGFYALRDWNLPEGKILDIMKNIVKENRGIDINDLKEKLSKVRYFTDKTFYIYVYKYFKKKGNKIYID
jgi:hypothetical protein